MDWRVFDRVEPIGGPAADYRFGMLAQNILAPHLERGTKAPHPLDFFPWTQRPDESILLSPDEMLAEFDRRFR